MWLLEGRVAQAEATAGIKVLRLECLSCSRAEGGAVWLEWSYVRGKMEDEVREGRGGLRRALEAMASTLAFARSELGAMAGSEQKRDTS